MLSQLAGPPRSHVVTSKMAHHRACNLGPVPITIIDELYTGLLRYVGQCAAGNLFHFLEYEQTETKEFANIHGPSIVRLRELLLGLTRTQPKLRFLQTQLQEVIELFDKDVPQAIENKNNLPRKPWRS